ncbi:LOW QUALITY PROTEIN: hypothetical protein OSB04_un001450 [Centaurea solstitialis]|uniref:Small ribosomal subunit protein uS7 domain-containing protein n=1 Tax=Centaurea solstitialis TaxID=347529 RepID=A0AA38S249_9ASTR|nr:LOW QUALITY PROTEIN: hypothetical protein OSB04_un001450 [Centaurea solstitialis]
MSRRGTAEKKLQNPIQFILTCWLPVSETRKKIIGLSNYLSSREKIQQKTETNPLSVYVKQYMDNSGIAVKARRVGGSTHQVPIEIDPHKEKHLPFVARPENVRSKYAFKLSSELVDAAKGVRCHTQKGKTHRMARQIELCTFQKPFVCFSSMEVDFPECILIFGPNSSSDDRFNL